MKDQIQSIHIQDLLEPQAQMRFDGAHVQMQGFVHQIDDGWLLSNSACLHSCCIKTPSLQKGSIRLTGELSQVHAERQVGRALRVEGTLFLQETPQKDKTWSLAVARVTQNRQEFLASYENFAQFGLGFCALLMLYFLLRSRLKRFFY